MPHLDEGTLHALLDGELDLAEVKEIQIHLGTCSACGSRLQDVKEFLAEADRLVGTLETPSGAARIQPEPAPAPPATPPRSTPRAAPREPVWDTPPELFLPDSGDDTARRRRWTRRLRWAAMIVVILGAGRILSSAFESKSPQLQLSERDLTSATPATPPAVVSPQETARPQTRIAREVPPPVNRSRADRRAPEPKALATQPAADTAPDQVDSALEAYEDTADVSAQAGLAAANRADSEVVEPPPPEERPAADQDLATRQAAAAALEELDRERRRSRAAAATAALPPARPEPQPAAEAPPPAPRTLEQRSQIYLRIGLDEAAKQLGRPVHVIEGMTPEFMGLAQGRLVAGADPGRPVVRVVYRDTRGRMILLDQQRLRTGQAPGAASGNLRWALGDVMLYLHGEPGSEVLRNLQRRVR
jgi:hypothetical protein